MPKVDFKRVETDAEVENIEIKDGQLIYSKSGKTFMDYGDERIPTGSGGNGGKEEVVISPEEPTNEDWKIWINPYEPINNIGTEVVDSLDGNEKNMAPSVNAVNEQNTWKLHGTTTSINPLDLSSINFNELYIKASLKTSESDEGISIDFHLIKQALSSSLSSYRKGYYDTTSTNGMIYLDVNKSSIKINYAARNGTNITSFSTIDVYYK